MKKKKKAPLGKFAVGSLLLGYASIKILEKELPTEIRQDVNELDEAISNRISEEDRNRFKDNFGGIKERYNKTFSDIDQRIDNTVNQKVAELEKEETMAANTGTTQGTQVSNSVAIPNQYFPSYNFSDETYYKMVKLAAAEQGNTNKRGMAVEMSVMFNLYEGPIYNKIFKRSTEEEGFVEFISTNGNHREADFLIMLNI